MFNGDPHHPPKFTTGQVVHVTGALLGVKDLPQAFTVSLPHDPVTGPIVPKGYLMPHNMQYQITEVRPSSNDQHEHQYVIKPLESALWEVKESEVLLSPFQPGDHVVKKGCQLAEIELVKESMVYCQLQPGTMPDGTSVIKKKVMLRLVDEVGVESVDEAEKYRTADKSKGEEYFPLTYENALTDQESNETSVKHG